MYNPQCFNKQIVFVFEIMHYKMNEFIVTVSTFLACDESRELAIQVLPNNVERYAAK